MSAGCKGFVDLSWRSVRRLDRGRRLNGKCESSPRKRSERRPSKYRYPVSENVSDGANRRLEVRADKPSRTEQEHPAAEEERLTVATAEEPITLAAAAEVDASFENYRCPDQRNSSVARPIHDHRTVETVPNGPKPS
jgi:hypothetical protein